MSDVTRILNAAQAGDPSAAEQLRMLDGLANLDDQLESFLRGKALLITKVGHLHAADQFHHEVRATCARRSGIEHLGNIRVVHPSQRLSLGFEPGKDALSYLMVSAKRFIQPEDNPKPCRSCLG